MKKKQQKRLPKQKTPEQSEKTYSDSKISTLSLTADKNRLFEENIMCYCKRLYAYLYYQCRDEDLSKDMMQETLIEAHAQLHKGNFEEKGSTWFWLQKVAKNRLIGYYRTQSIHNALMQANQNQICDNLGWTRLPATEDYSVNRDKNGSLRIFDTLDRRKSRISLNIEVLMKSNFRILHISEADRWLIKQHHQHQRTFKELSLILEKPLSTVMSRYYTVMKKLQRQLMSLESMGAFDKKLKRKDLYILERSIGRKYKKKSDRRKD